MRRRGPATVAGLLVLVGSLTTGCGGNGPATPSPSALPLIGAQGVQLVTGGIPGPLPSSVPLVGNLSATITLFDGTVTYDRMMEIALFRGDDQSAFVDGAEIHALNSMLLMDHGTFEATAQARGKGRYRLPLPFTMAGEWQLAIQMTTPTESAELVLSLDVLD